MVLSFNKSFVIAVLLLFSTKIANAQAPENLESKAVNYLLENMTSIDKNLEHVKIYYKKTTDGRPTKVFAVAHGVGDINLVKDSIPNKDYLNQLDDGNNNIPSSFQVKKLDIVNNKRNKKGKIKNELSVFNAIEYKGNMYVQLTLSNTESRRYETIIVKFDKDVPVASYTSVIVFDIYLKGQFKTNTSP